MDAANNYWFIWLLYGLAGAAFYWVFWRITAFRKRLWISYSLRALMLALMVTPWYANVEGESLAPALMVVMMDTITIGTQASGRALLPLLMALVLAEICASIMFLIKRKKINQVKTTS